MRLYPILSQSIEKENLSELLYEIELPLTRVLAEIEIAGVRIDVAALNEASETLTSRLDGIETEIHALVGENFNIGSPAQVGEILFDKLKLDPKAKKTKTGQYSTSEEVLEKISHLHPVVNKILEYRQLKKLLSTYLNALPNTINPTTGKIHTTYNQTVTATGRLSSTDPNLQNIYASPARELCSEKRKGQRCPGIGKSIDAVKSRPHRARGDKFQEQGPNDGQNSQQGDSGSCQHEP